VRSTGPRSAGHQGLAGAGVTGKLGTIKRSDGSLQATYDGYPFFTYIGGSAPGRASGNWVYLNGGLW
jgi:predicted lipoprotein with Yx(FWY)xxD motif